MGYWTREQVSILNMRFYLECLYHLTTLISKFHIVTYSNLQLNKFCYIVLPASLSDILSTVVIRLLVRNLFLLHPNFESNDLNLFLLLDFYDAKQVACRITGGRNSEQE